jgi:cysteine desulfurase/selenocysteine lyase
MKAGIELITEIGVPAISRQLLRLTARLRQRLGDLGYELLGAATGSEAASGITTITHAEKPLEPIFERLTSAGIFASLRHNRAGRAHIRFSPHFYNTEAEMDRVADVIGRDQTLGR